MNSNLILITPDGYSFTATGGTGSLNLGTAAPFAVLAASTITNTNNTVVTGNLGLYAGTSVTGFPPGTVVGTQHITDSVAQQAEIDANTAFVAGNALPPGTPIVADLGGQTLPPGTYTAASSAGITGTVVLDAAGNPNASWLFQIGSTLTTASSSVVSLINGANAANVFWLVGSSATLGTTSTFKGTIIAKASITDDGSAVVSGRFLALTAAVTLNNTQITTPAGGSAGSTGFKSNWMDKRSAKSVSVTLTMVGTTAPDGYAWLQVSDCPEQFGGSLGMPQFNSNPVDAFTILSTGQQITTNAPYYWSIESSARWVRLIYTPTVDVNGLAVHVYANCPYCSPG